MGGIVVGPELGLLGAVSARSGRGRGRGQGGDGQDVPSSRAGSRTGAPAGSGSVPDTLFLAHRPLTGRS